MALSLPRCKGTVYLLWIRNSSFSGMEKRIATYSRGAIGPIVSSSFIRKYNSRVNSRDSRELSRKSVCIICLLNIRIMSSYVFKGKMVIVGDIAVGKTSLASRFVDDKFTRNHIASVGGILYDCRMSI